jgi:hypothetical protein
MVEVKNAIASVGENAPDAEVVDLTGHAHTGRST